MAMPVEALQQALHALEHGDERVARDILNRIVGDEGREEDQFDEQGRLLVPAAQARQRLPELMGRVAATRERVLFTRRGRTLAALVPVDDVERLTEADKLGHVDPALLKERVARVAGMVKVAVLAILPDAELILYGSRARGDARKDSDWDFVVLTDAPVTFALKEKVRRAMDAISLDINAVISAFVKSREEWQSPSGQASPYQQSVTREGIAL